MMDENEALLSGLMVFAKGIRERGFNGNHSGSRACVPAYGNTAFFGK
jgi:hypothetical protein